MQRNTVGLIWIFGVLLAAALYATGPDRFVQAALAAWDGTARLIADLVAALSVNAFELVRSLAIALFAVFLALCLVAARRGRRVRAALVTVSVVFLLCVGAPGGEGLGAPGVNWLAALVLVGVGAAVMTRRLAEPAAPPGWPGGWAGPHRRS